MVGCRSSIVVVAGLFRLHPHDHNHFPQVGPRQNNRYERKELGEKADHSLYLENLCFVAMAIHNPDPMHPLLGLGKASYQCLGFRSRFDSANMNRHVHPCTHFHRCPVQP